MRHAPGPEALRTPPPTLPPLAQRGGPLKQRAVEEAASCTFCVCAWHGSAGRRGVRQYTVSVEAPKSCTNKGHCQSVANLIHLVPAWLQNRVPIKIIVPQSLGGAA